ncbi:MAG TPA: glycosyltransferase family 2 protein, partial [Bacteroidia bacterium]|nr:glycosyltransferase family 2 protein [Bacteroidia bacterium]
MIPQPVFFSIVIPTYNRADLIMKTLASVFSQTYLHYEVIVVDNCSTDNTEEVLSGCIQAGKIRYLKNDRNYERSWSRNRGMENAKGDFVTFLDSDDFMYPDNLKDAAVFV